MPNEKQPADPSIFSDKLHILPVPEKLRSLGRVISHLVLGPHLFSPISDHTFENRGAAPMIDKLLYDGPNQMTLPYEEAGE